MKLYLINFWIKVCILFVVEFIVSSNVFGQHVYTANQIDSIYNAAEEYYAKNESDKGWESLKEFEKANRLTYGSTSIEYARVLHFFAAMYAENKDFSGAFKIEYRAATIASELLEYKEDHLKFLLFASLYARNNSDSDNAISLGLKAWNIIDLYGNREDKIALAQTLAQIYYDRSQLVESISFLKFVDQCSDELETDTFYKNRIFLAECCLDLGNTADADKYLKSICVSELENNKKYSLLCQYYFIVSKLYDKIGRHSEAVHMSKTSLALRENVYGKESSQYVSQLLDMSGYELHLNNVISAIKMAEEALILAHKIKDKGKEAIALNILSDANDSIIGYSQKKEYAVQSLQLRKDIFGEDSPEYAIGIINSLHYRYEDMRKNYSKIKKELSLAKNIFESCFGIESEKYLHTILLEALCEGIAKNKNEAFSLINDHFSLSKKNFITNCSQFTKRDREIYWNSCEDFFSTLFKIVSLYDFEEKNLNGLAYNAILWRKEYLLNLEKIIENKELTPYNVDEFYSFNWETIAKSLAKDEAAIEFVKANGFYWALLLKNNSEYPIWVKLASTDKIDEIIQNKSFHDDLKDIYNTIWKPLVYKLSKVNKLYISPDGDIHGLPIECSLNVFKPCSVIRLSTTRTIVERNNMASPRHIVLYGGLDYDNNGSNDSSSLLNTNYDTTIERSEVRTIIGSLEEVKNIIELLPDSIDYRLYVGSQGTEESFKHLPYKEVNLLHISTHGFYHPQIMHSELNNNYEATEEDRSLANSGLYLAGVNSKTVACNNNENLNDDGIITALEISTMDFSNLNLVVLSACQTAKGDIHPDGVFGLQRGFKKAGAKSLLLSLWNVNDFATKVLMTEFYRQLFLGKTTNEALDCAQRYVKEYKDKQGHFLFESPYYWAAFVTIDSIDK